MKSGREKSIYVSIKSESPGFERDEAESLEVGNQFAAWKLFSVG
jgi:hypothetical protein